MQERASGDCSQRALMCLSLQPGRPSVSRDPPPLSPGLSLFLTTFWTSVGGAYLLPNLPVIPLWLKPALSLEAGTRVHPQGHMSQAWTWVSGQTGRVGRQAGSSRLWEILCAPSEWPRFPLIVLDYPSVPVPALGESPSLQLPYMF